MSSSNDDGLGEQAPAPAATIREATLKDIDDIYAMVIELAEYEKVPELCKATPELLAKNHGFHGGPAYAHTLLVFEGDKPVGMALSFYNFSTFTAKPGLYLEDLFVREKYRKKGYGTALLAALAREVVKLDGGRLDWQVLKNNQPSIDFYRKIGAKEMDEWMNMRVDGDGLKKLGEMGPILPFVKSQGT